MYRRSVGCTLTPYFLCDFELHLMSTYPKYTSQKILDITNFRSDLPEDSVQPNKNHEVFKKF